jgi:two-component sensor histidine kinase
MKQAGPVVLCLALLAGVTWRPRKPISALEQLRGENRMLREKLEEQGRTLDDVRRQADDERQRVEAMMGDAHHQIVNSLATVSSLVSLQILRSDTEAVSVALDAARARVHTIAAVHRRARVEGRCQTIGADEVLKAVLGEIALTSRAAVRIQAGAMEPIALQLRDATSLGIITGELVRNALEHGFPNGSEGLISVRLERDAAGVVTLEVTDDGIGMSQGSPIGRNGLGTAIVAQLAQQFRGKPAYHQRIEGGLTATVTLPSLSDMPS